jgi:hypothetical protein
VREFVLGPGDGSQDCFAAHRVVRYSGPERVESATAQ